MSELLEAASREGIFAIASVVFIMFIWRLISHIIETNNEREQRYIDIIADQKETNTEYLKKLGKISSTLENLSNKLQNHEESISCMEDKIDDIDFTTRMMQRESVKSESDN